MQLFTMNLLSALVPNYQHLAILTPIKAWPVRPISHYRFRSDWMQWYLVFSSQWQSQAITGKYGGWLLISKWGRRKPPSSLLQIVGCVRKAYMAVIRPVVFLSCNGNLQKKVQDLCSSLIKSTIVEFLMDF